MINKRLTCGFSASVFGSFCAERGQTRRLNRLWLISLGGQTVSAAAREKIQGHALDLIRAG
jgi:hypothetical protein